LHGKGVTRSSEDTRDDLEGVGERDLKMGMIVGAVMAFGAIALAIIFGVT
jgi:hypothetical protein